MESSADIVCSLYGVYLRYKAELTAVGTRLTTSRRYRYSRYMLKAWTMKMPGMTGHVIGAGINAQDYAAGEDIPDQTIQVVIA